jgi:beta-mannosidase
MLDTFRLPKDFESLVYLSLVLQAEGIRYGVEHWRRHMDRVAGTLYWQLNDCWPVASWSSLDYFGRWKALHYAARRFYAPVMLSIEDNPPEQALHVTSDLLDPWEGQIRWSLETLDGQVLASGEEQVKAAPLSSTHVCTLNFADRVCDDNVREVVFVAELWQGGRRLALQMASFVPTKHLSLADPAVAATARSEAAHLVVDLQSRSAARLVQLSMEGADVIFSDNYFDLPAGRQVTITCPMPAEWTLEQARSVLNVRSVYDSYAH